MRIVMVTTVINLWFLSAQSLLHGSDSKLIPSSIELVFKNTIDDAVDTTVYCQVAQLMYGEASCNRDRYLPTSTTLGSSYQYQLNAKQPYQYGQAQPYQGLALKCTVNNKKHYYTYGKDCFCCGVVDPIAGLEPKTDQHNQIIGIKTSANNTCGGQLLQLNKDCTCTAAETGSC